jgi:hypothetical protein
VKWSTHLVLIQAFRGSSPLRTTIFFMRIKKRKQSFLFKNVYLYKKNGWGNWIRTSEMADSESAALPLGYTPKKMAGVTGFEPVKWQIQSLLPYRLAIPQQQFILYIYFRRCKEKNDKNSYKICAKPYRVHAYR